MVQQARTAYQQGSSTFDAARAMVQIAAVAGVQQTELATAISDVSTQLASDPAFTIADSAGQLESVSAL